MTSTHGSVTLDRQRLRGLAETVTGAVLTPGTDGYDDARHIFFQHLDQAPAVIVQPQDTDDIVAALAFARSNGLEVAVRAGGHSGAAHSTVEGGLVIDLRHLDSIDIDVDDRTVRIGGGATAGAVTGALGEHGLVLGFGDTGTVGVGGITLGGGVGFLSRLHGLTIDNLLAAELVTADGRVVVADADHHPDLFWALRGGGGNFGVATRFTFRLHRLDQVVGGMLILPATADTIAGFVRHAQHAPDELTCIVNVMPAPPMPFLPPEQHGRLVLFALVTFAGTATEAEPVLAPFRALATPLADLVREIPYAGMFQPAPEDYRPVAAGRNGYADDFDRTSAQLALDTLTAQLAKPEVQMAVAQLRPLGGAIARVSPDATAYAHRQRALMVNVAAIVNRPEELDAQLPWLDALKAALCGGTPGGYANFVYDDGPDRIHDIYPADTYTRLARVKAQWDPDNVFHRNHTVLPAS